MQGFRTGVLAASIVAITLLSGACSRDAAQARTAAGTPADLVLPGADIRACGLETSSPQVYLFSGDGDPLSTEIGYAPGKPLNVESGKPGRGMDNLDKLKACLAGGGIDAAAWEACGQDFCVVQMLPDRSVGECPYCDLTQQQLRTYFESRHAKVAYHTLYFK